MQRPNRWCPNHHSVRPSPPSMMLSSLVAGARRACAPKHICATVVGVRCRCEHSTALARFLHAASVLHAVRADTQDLPPLPPCRRRVRRLVAPSRRANAPPPTRAPLEPRRTRDCRRTRRAPPALALQCAQNGPAAQGTHVGRWALRRVPCGLTRAVVASQARWQVCHQRGPLHPCRH